MSYIDKDIENQELSAELLIETYFPDVKEWKASYGSFFSRNYTGDLKSVNPNMNSLSLSRNGIYDILPEKMFFDVEELRFKESRELASRISEIYEEEKNIKDYFMPFDSFFFNQSLRLHKVSSHIVDHEVEILLKLYYDYDIEAEENKYVRQLAPSLLHVVELRSNLDALANMLTEIVQCRVEYSRKYGKHTLYRSQARAHQQGIQRFYERFETIVRFLAGMVLADGDGMRL